MLRIPIVRAHDVSKQIPREKKFFHLVENVIKQLVHTTVVRSSMKHAESLERTQKAGVVHG